MKKFFSVSLILLFAFFIVSCNSNNTNGNEDNNHNGDVGDNGDNEDMKPEITVLNNLSDYATEDTNDKLILSNDVASFEYTSSQPELYVIEDGIGRVNKIEQKHQKQEVTITVDVTYNDGTTDQKSKNIVVAPIVYPDMNINPIATYFNAGALSKYFPYSNYYQETGEIFSSSVRTELDMVYYAFANPSMDGTVRVGGNQYELLKPLKKDNVRVLLVIDGVGKASSDAFWANTSPSRIDNFVTNIMDLVDELGFDGVDIDWEPFNGGVDKNQMDELMRKLRSEMDERQDEGGTPYILTTALPGSGVQLATWYNINNIAEVADYINFMTYDFHHSTTLTHVTPVSKVVELIDYLKRVDFPLNKAIMGSGTYGKAYKVDQLGVDNPVNKTGKLTLISEVEPQGSFTSGTLYYQAIEELMKNPSYVENHVYNGDQLVGSYLYNKDEGIYITFESETSAKAKMDLIHQYPGMGIMQWSFAQDANNIIINHFIITRLLNQSQ